MTNDAKKWGLYLSKSSQMTMDERIFEKIVVNIDREALYKTAEEWKIFNINEKVFLVNAHGEQLEVIDHNTSETPKANSQPEPPSAADFIITAMMGSKAADAAIGDLTEVFRKNISSGMSIRRANAKYWGEVVFLAGPMLKEMAKRFGLLALAGKLLGL